jgi:hypothetical protein
VSVFSNSKNQREEVRIAVLEEKITTYEHISREMLEKLEVAVDKINETNQNISKMLIRHEERLDQSTASDAAILKLLEDTKEDIWEDLEEKKEVIKSLSKRMDEISKFKWILAGILLVVGIVAGQVNVLESLMPSPSAMTSGK